MKNHYQQIELLAGKFNLATNAVNAINALLDNTLPTQFWFSQMQYDFNAVMPDSLYSALLPYVELGIDINPASTRLEAVYNPASATLLFDASLTEHGLHETLAAYTDLEVTCHLVYEGDDLEIDTAKEVIQHQRNHKSSVVEGAYCIVAVAEGDSWLTTMSKEEVAAAFDANINDRLNGVNPYTTQDVAHEIQRLSCIYRALKTIANMTNIRNYELVQQLLAIHSAGYSRAKELRKVVMISQRAFRGINANQTSPIEDLYQRANPENVIAFNPVEVKRKAVKLEQQPPVVKVDELEFGVGF
jgi:hypothetical protein